MLVKFKRYVYPKLNSGSISGLVAVTPLGDSIPKVIHQTFPTSSLPEIIQKNVNHIKQLNPTWEYKLYTDEDIESFILKHYSGRVLDYYNRINIAYGSARADVFRYLLLYKIGGVYLDIKASLKLPLDNVIKSDDVFILSHWKDISELRFPGWGMHTELEHIESGELQQWHIVSAPGHPFLKAVLESVFRNIDIYDSHIHGTGKTGVLRLTGPIAYTLSIFPLIPLNKHRFAQSFSDLGFDYTIFVEHEKHTTLFKTHYMQQTIPIVKPSPIAALISLMRRILRKIFLIKY